jgi:hypothetical protein
MWSLSPTDVEPTLRRVFLPAAYTSYATSTVGSTVYTCLRKSQRDFPQPPAESPNDVPTANWKRRRRSSTGCDCSSLRTLPAAYTSYTTITVRSTLDTCPHKIYRDYRSSHATRQW